MRTKIGRADSMLKTVCKSGSGHWTEHGLLHMRHMLKIFSLPLIVLVMSPVAANADEVFFSYERVQPMAAGDDNRYVLKWWTDGRVEIRVPAYARQGGAYTLSPGEYDFPGLEEIMDITADNQAMFQAAPAAIQSLRNQEMREVHDADQVHIRTHPYSRAPVDLQIDSPDYWNRAYPDSQSLALVSSVDRRVMDWINKHAGTR